MATFTVTITDPSALAGITAARTDYNNKLPLIAGPKDINGNPTLIVDTANLLNTDNDYVQYIMDQASKSYAKSYGLTITVPEKAALQQKLATAILVDDKGVPIQQAAPAVPVSV